MNRWIMLVFALLLALLSACTPYVYGVPEPTWNTMSEAERLETMRIYQERQQAYQRAMEERARQNAIELERQQARAAEAERVRLEHMRQQRIAAIHRGEGAYGDLLRVRLQHGRMWIAGRHRHYQPLTFTIADGEGLQLAVTDDDGRQTLLLVTYANRSLLIDAPGEAGNSGTARIPYDPQWREGGLYTDINSAGPLQLRGIEAFVEIAGAPRRTVTAPPPQVIVVEKQAPPPPQVVVIKEEQPRYQQPQVVVVEEEQPRYQQPQVVVVKEEQPRYQQPQVIVVRDDKPKAPTQVVVVRDDKPQSPPSQVGVTGEKPGFKRRDDTAATAQVLPPAQPPVMPVREIPPNEKKQPTATLPTDTKAPGRIDIQFVSGQIKLRGKHQTIEPLSVRINDGESREVSLKTSAGTQTIAVSYRNGVVAIDADPATGKGRATAARLQFEKEWKTGRVYRIDTKGRLSLEAAEVRIAAADGK